jgi:hypothetical protein
MNFLVMPFGLANMPFTFQAHYEWIFSSLLWYVLVFFDEILIYRKTWSENLVHLQEVLSILRPHQLFVHCKNCQFGQNSINYLENIFSSQGLVMDPEKISYLCYNGPSQAM